MGILKEFWTRRVAPPPDDGRIEYLFWYFDGNDRLTRTTCTRCAGDDDAVAVAAGRMVENDSSFEIYQVQRGRLVYRRNPLFPAADARTGAVA
jgi:hypothetical protein